MRVMILRSMFHGTRVRATMALACLPAWLLAAASQAGPPAAPAAPEAAVATAEVGKSRRALEEGMTELGAMASDAVKQNGADAQLAGCLEDKRDRGREVMEIATSELLVIQDGSSTAQQRQFATEKLDALALRMDQLVEGARACGGGTGPEDDDDKTKTDADEPTTVPYADPTIIGTGNSPVPPPVDDLAPPTVDSPTG
jgi:hypothetical protein